MIKFEGNNDIDEIEILDYNKYRGGYLNRQIILLLITLGVKEQVFIDMQHEYLEDLKNCELKDASIYK
jgi:RNA-dependent RNA polymerase